MRVGRTYAGRVRQLVTGSTGLDDWEWGVSLFAHDPYDIKAIVYEMRFDEVTHTYGEFGPFYNGLPLPHAGNLQARVVGLKLEQPPQGGEPRPHERGYDRYTNPAMIFTNIARIAVLNMNEIKPCRSASRRIFGDEICTSDTWQVIPMTKEK